MARSLGDAWAKRLGATADVDVRSVSPRELGADAVAVVASDGVSDQVPLGDLLNRVRGGLKAVADVQMEAEKAW